MLLFNKNIMQVILYLFTTICHAFCCIVNLFVIVVVFALFSSIKLHKFKIVGARRFFFFLVFFLFFICIYNYLFAFAVLSFLSSG